MLCGEIPFVLVGANDDFQVNAKGLHYGLITACVQFVRNMLSDP